MSTTEAAFIAMAMAASAAVAAGIVLPARSRVVWVGVFTALSATAGGVAALAVLVGGDSFVTVIPDVFPLGGVRLEFDALSALFTFGTALVAVPAAVYGIGYSRQGPSSRPAQAAWPLLVWSVMMVPAAGSAVGLIALWELMALSSTALVLAEHHHNSEARRAAQWYVAMTHLSLLAIALALFVLAHQAGGESFAAMRAGAANVGPVAASAVFLLALVGFGAKAGVVPLHVWLPRAHPEAPSHVSALMSGAMVKLGVYGLLRVGWDLLDGGPRWWGAVVLAVGLISAMFGILHALVASDLKRLLAYSTTENVGLIFVGVGAAGMFAASDNRPLAAVALAAALLHVLNHGAFKGLLFLGAGSVLTATGTRNLDHMGGLGRRMPVTAATFAIGGMALAALPPLNGFVSEWLLLQSLVHSLPSEAASVAVAMPVAVAVVALTGGLAAAAFVKAFGSAFLAMPRSAEAEAAHESPITMRTGMIALAGVCIALALLPTLLANPLERAIAPATGIADGAPISTNGVYVHLAGIQAGLSPLMLTLGLLIGVVAVFAVVRRSRARSTVRDIPPWGCGRTLQTARMEYTATSFAEPLQRVFDDVLHPEIDVVVDHRTESRHYVESIRYHSETRDGIENRLYEPLLAAARRWGDRARSVQNGSIHRYLTYSLVVTVVVLLVSQ